MKVVFLDIDGVLNHTDMFRVLNSCRNVDMLDERAVLLLNRFVERDVKFVLSSSWRCAFSVESVEDDLKEKGFKGELIGATPIMGDGHRGREIETWLLLHPEVKDFIILDDCSGMEPLMHRLVQTDVDVGLTGEHVDIAMKLLGVA